MKKVHHTIKDIEVSTVLLCAPCQTAVTVHDTDECTRLVSLSHDHALG